MQIMRTTVDWFVMNGGPALAMAHLDEAMPVTAEKGEFREVDYRSYVEFEEVGCLLALVALDEENDNKLVGYVVGTASPSIHNKGFFEFTTTAFYTIPEYRGRGVNRMLFEGLHTVCAECNVSEINYMVSESNPDAAIAVEKLGMVKAETMYSMKVKHG